MQKSEDAATPMPLDFKKIKFVVGNKEIFDSMPAVKALPVYSDVVLDFLADLSSVLLKSGLARKYKDMSGFAYWIRKANLLKHKNRILDVGSKIGRGLTFHIAPSNIPVQFAVSLVPSILAGNSNIIRLSARELAQTEIICKKIQSLLDEKYEYLKPYICMINYGYDDQITGYISGKCNTRVIWGGDNTIEKIKRYPIGARAIDICFADRFSIAVINSEKLEESKLEDFVNRFWLDTYFIDQNACSSPRMVCWLGKNETMIEKFWRVLEKKARSEYKMQPVQAVDKFTNAAEAGMLFGGRLHHSSNYVVRMEVESLRPEYFEYKCGGGLFYECKVPALGDLLPVLDDHKCQTIGYFGIDPGVLKDFVFEQGIKGVDRIVPIGRTTNPGLRWDGFDLVNAMSRYIEAE